MSIAAPPSYRERGVQPLYVFVRPDGEQFDELGMLVEDRRLVVELQDVLPLGEAARAHEPLRRRATSGGKLVLRVE